MTELSDYNPDRLPPVIVRYLQEHTDSEQRVSVAEVFAANARVVDESVEYVGTDAIKGWLDKAASAYSYTTTLLGQGSTGANRWVVLARLEGDFPGGVVDLHYRFTTDEDRIVDLVIAP